MITLVTSSASHGDEWSRMPSLPDKEGFAGMFAGVSNETLLVAGGANFPELRPWEGGQKVWYDSVFALGASNGQWKDVGRLPRALGYGVSVTYGNAVICVGGSDVDRHYADAFRLEWKNGKLITTKLPSLPRAVANASGALVGDVLYVAGGIEEPSSSTTLKAAWRIDLSAAKPLWDEIDAWPGRGRMLAIAAGVEGRFWLAGGTDLFVGKNDKVERTYLKDAYCFDPLTGWKQIADLPSSIVAPPSPAPADASGFYVLGGDDGSQVGVAPDQHKGFGKQVLRYDAKADRWIKVGELVAPRVTVPCVQWNESWVVPSGEERPGIRSPEVWAWTPGKQE